MQGRALAAHGPMCECAFPLPPPLRRWGQHRFAQPVRGLALGLLAALAIGACSDSPTRPAQLQPAALELTIQSFARLDAGADGTYEAWVVDADDVVRSAGRFSVAGGAEEIVTLESPIGDPAHVMITIEPPGDTDPAPSLRRLAGGRVAGGRAVLEYNGYLTPGVPLEDVPGTHVLFTPSNNGEMGYPSTEDAGIWIFNIDGDSADGSFFITLTPLTEGWTYEGWVVRDWGQPNAVWLSYGKFRPDARRKVNSRDNSGLGPYSGQIDYRFAMTQEIYMPGDDWVSNPHGYPLPADVTLPLDLNGCIPTVSDCSQPGQKAGLSRWTHVITIEPREDENESPWMARPSPIRPYRNAIGEANWFTARTIGFFPDVLPRASARILRDQN